MCENKIEEKLEQNYNDVETVMHEKYDKKESCICEKKMREKTIMLKEVVKVTVAVTDGLLIDRLA